MKGETLIWEGRSSQLINLGTYLICIVLIIFSVDIYCQSPDEELQNVLQKLDMGEPVEHTIINLSNVKFASGSTQLEPEAKNYLDKVAKLLNLTPNMNLLIKGHTDNTGSAAINERISQERAEAIKQYLVTQNIDEGRLAAKGFGSSLPIMDNNTPEGRAKNRRVEIEILKTENMNTIQDFIVLRNGDRIAAVIDEYDNEGVTYRQFSIDSEHRISNDSIEKIIFANGKEVNFDIPSNPSAQSIEEDEVEEAEDKKAGKPNFKFLLHPFYESTAFHRGQFVVGAGLGFGNNIGIGHKDNNISPPPLWMTLEIPLKHNLGVGLSGGMMKWKPESIEGVKFTYFSISPRLAYHFNVIEQIDFYTGLAITGRFAALNAKEQGRANPLRKNKFDASLFVGLRYFFNNFLGAYAEYGNDNVACFRLGLAARFGN